MRDARDGRRSGLGESRGRPRHATALWVAAGAVVTGFLLHVLWLRAVVDDAFITFRYARHLAQGHGFVWNVGEPAVEGFTSVLWVLLAAVGTWLRADLVVASQIAGVVASLGTLGYTALAARHRLGLSPLTALVPCALLAASGPFATWAASGMETSLFAFLVLAAAYHATADDDGGACASSRARPLGVAALLFAATLTRPEGLGVFTLLVLGLVLARRTRGLPTLVVAYAVPLALLVAWRWSTFGDLVPNTFHAKTGLSPYVPVRGLLYTLYFVAFYVAPWIPLVLLARRRPRPAADRASAAATIDDGGARAARIVGGVVLAGWTLYVVAVGGDYMAMNRFFVPVLAFVDLALGLAIARALAGGSRAPAVAAIALGALVTLVHSTPFDERLFGRPRAQAGNYAGVVNERYAVGRFTAVGRWLDGYRRDEREMIAVKVIGAIGWHAHLRVLDMLGLTDPHIARVKTTAKPLGLGYPGHERSDLAYVASRRPTYVLLEIDDAPRRVSHPDWGDAATNEMLVREYVVREARVAGPRAARAQATDSLYVYFLERAESAARRGP